MNARPKKQPFVRQLMQDSHHKQSSAQTVRMDAKAELFAIDPKAAAASSPARPPRRIS
jgi:hypothetical protein